MEPNLLAVSVEGGEASKSPTLPRSPNTSGDLRQLSVTVCGDLALIVMAGLRRACSITVAAVSATQGSLPSKTDDHIPGPRGRGGRRPRHLDDPIRGAYERAVGVALEPGSLNVVIDRPWAMQQPTVRLEADAVGVGLGFVRCQVGGLSGWIVRTDKNNQGWGDHGLDVLEIVSPVHLRTALGLVDGDDVVVEVDEPRDSKEGSND